MGLVPSAPVFVAWGTDNAAPDTVRVVTTAIIPGKNVSCWSCPCLIDLSVKVWVPSVPLLRKWTDVLYSKLLAVVLIRSSVWTYLPKDAPNYHNGNSLNLASSSAVCVLAIVGALYVRWENAKRARGERNHRLEGKTALEIERLGYLHPEFRYQI